MVVILNFIPLIYIFFIGFSSIDLYKLFEFTCNSFLLAVISVLLSFVFALPSAYVFVYKDGYYKYFVISILMLISILPPFLISIMLSNLSDFFGFENGFGIVSFAHMIIIFPYTLALMVLGFSFVPKSAIYASKLYATNFLKGFVMFYLPFMKSVFLVAFILGITISMSQYILSLMLSSPSFSTLMLQIIPYLKSADLKSANTYALVFIANSAFAIYIFYRLRNVISKNN
jgi:ABC-type spermidine/putrescine transport system permease subunit II